MKAFEEEKKHSSHDYIAHHQPIISLPMMHHALKVDDAVLCSEAAEEDMHDLDDHTNTHAHIFTPPRMMARPGRKKNACADHVPSGPVMTRQLFGDISSPCTLSSQPTSPAHGPMRRCAAMQHMARNAAHLDGTLHDGSAFVSMFIVGDALKNRTDDKIAQTELVMKMAKLELETNPAADMTPYIRTSHITGNLRRHFRHIHAPSPSTHNTQSIESQPETSHADPDRKSTVTIKRGATDPTAAVKEIWKQLRAEMKLANSAKSLYQHQSSPGI